MQQDVNVLYVPLQNTMAWIMQLHASPAHMVGLPSKQDLHHLQIAYLVRKSVKIVDHSMKCVGNIALSCSSLHGSLYSSWSHKRSCSSCTWPYLRQGTHPTMGAPMRHGT